MRVGRTQIGACTNPCFEVSRSLSKYQLAMAHPPGPPAIGGFQLNFWALVLVGLGYLPLRINGTPETLFKKKEKRKKKKEKRRANLKS
jgi:hypothetical protein